MGAINVGHANRLSSSAWSRARRAVLDRDAGQCQLGYPGCTLLATEVDHIIPLTNGGARFDPSNLRAVCATCHRSRPTNPRRTASRAW